MTASEYYSFLLRIWHLPTDDDRSWRIMLEDVRTGEKYGYANFEDLLAYLQQLSSAQNQSSIKESI